MAVRVCFVGGTKLAKPLGATAEKKYRALHELGNLFVIGFSQGLRPHVFSQHARFYLLPNVPIAVLRYAELFTIGPILLLWIVLRHRIQIVVAQSPHEAVPCAVTKTIAKWMGHQIALIVESHGDFEKSIFLQRTVPRPRLYKLAMEGFAHFSFKKADVLRAVSSSTCLQLQQWAPRLPIIQFPTWTDIEVFMAAGQKSRERSAQHILYCGMLIPRKGVHHLINAVGEIVEDFPTLTLTIVGRKENREYAASLTESVYELGLEKIVFFIDEVPQADLADRMRMASVLVLPSYSEGLPRVVFEAMAAGLPILASRVDGIPDIIKDGQTGWLIEPGDEQALAARLSWVFRYESEASQVAQRARAMAADVFSTERYVNGYSQLFVLAMEATGIRTEKRVAATF